jgi:hypothetical protein
MASKKNKAQAVQLFNELHKRFIIDTYGKNDKPAMRMAWNDYTDALCKNGEITEHQFRTWASPIK